MIVAVNVDPVNPGGWADPNRLLQLGFTGVSVVSRSNTHQYGWDAREAGLHVLARIDSTSNGWMIPANTYQIGNEPDIVSPSSWTMTPTEWIALWNQYHNTYPTLQLIGPGLASGDPTWWKQVSNKVSGCGGVGVHPYAKKAGEALELLQLYVNVTPKRKLWVSEWNRPAVEIRTFFGMLASVCAYFSWFCWSDAMVPPMGLVDTSGNSKPELDEICGAISNW